MPERSWRPPWRRHGDHDRAARDSPRLLARRRGSARPPPGERTDPCTLKASSMRPRKTSVPSGSTATSSPVSQAAFSTGDSLPPDPTATARDAPTTDSAPRRPGVGGAPPTRTSKPGTGRPRQSARALPGTLLTKELNISVQPRLSSSRLPNLLHPGVEYATRERFSGRQHQAQAADRIDMALPANQPGNRCQRPRPRDQHRRAVARELAEHRR